MISRRCVIGFFATATLPMTAAATSALAFDHGHGAWSALLRKHVVRINGGNGSQVRYSGVLADHDALSTYLRSLSAVTKESFDQFSASQQKAFLINSYNAFTVELILTKYPKLQSIKDLGGIVSGPWSRAFVPLLGSTLTLDNIEQDILRKRGRYDDPRIHFALNCASIGCPMLREEAYVAETLDAQLDNQALRFLSDQSRNRYNPLTKQLEVSRIFDWYAEDFRLGHRGVGSPTDFLARYADQLAQQASDRERVKAQRAPIVYVAYDWRLNDAQR